MSRLRKPHGLMIWPLLVTLLWATGCVRPVGLQGNDAAAHADPPTVPFQNGAAATRPSQTMESLDNAANSDSELPFHDSLSLPAGTLLTVRLKNPISTEDPNANLEFEAVLDEPVIIEGNKLVPSGVTVSGRVESTRASSLKRNRVYARLALDSIHLVGATLPVQTASLFVKGNASDALIPPGSGPRGDASTGVIRIEKGRRLTFRLSEPVYVAAAHRLQADR